MQPAVVRQRFEEGVKGLVEVFATRSAQQLNALRSRNQWVGQHFSHLRIGHHVGSQRQHALPLGQPATLLRQ